MNGRRLALLVSALAACLLSFLYSSLGQPAAAPSVPEETKPPSQNIELDQPDLMAGVPGPTGEYQVVAFKDRGNTAALAAKTFSAMRWFSTGFPQPVRLPGQAVPFRVDEPNRTLILFVRLLNDQQKLALAESANSKYADRLAATFTDANIYLVPLQFFNVTIAVEDGQGSERLFRGSAQTTKSTVLGIIFKCNTKDDLTLLKDQISNGVLATCEYLFAGQKVETNTLRITTDDIEKLGLKTQLGGEGSAMYVTRKQLADIAGSVYQSLDIREEYEIDEEGFSQEFVEAVIKQVLSTTYQKQRMEDVVAKLSSAFFPSVLKDIEPNVIKHEMSKAFELKKTNNTSHIVVNRDLWDEGKKAFSTSGNLHMAGSALELFSAETDVAFALSREDAWKNGSKSLDDQLKELSRYGESNIEWEIDGDRVVPKTVSVVSTASANFGQQFQLSRIKTMRRDNSFGSNEQFHTVFDLAVAEHADTEDKLFGEISRIDGLLTPVGSVVMWWGAKSGIPKAFELCDGGQVATSDSPIKGKKKPNLAGRFPMGTGDVADVSLAPVYDGHNVIEERRSGGTVLNVSQLAKHSHPVNDPGHDHSFSYTGSAGERSDDADDRDVAKVAGLSGTTSKSGTGISIAPEGGDQPHDHLIPAHDNRPAFVEVHFIIRVK